MILWWVQCIFSFQINVTKNDEYYFYSNLSRKRSQFACCIFVKFPTLMEITKLRNSFYYTTDDYNETNI